MCRVRVRRSKGRARPWKLAEGCHLHLRRGRASRDTAWETGRASANEQSERGVVGGGDCSARRSLGQENAWRRRFRRKLSMHTRRRGAAQLLSDRCTWHGAVVDSLARDDARNQAARVRLGAMLSRPWADDRVWIRSTVRWCGGVVLPTDGRVFLCYRSWRGFPIKRSNIVKSSLMAVTNRYKSSKLSWG